MTINVITSKISLISYLTCVILKEFRNRALHKCLMSPTVW